MEAVVAKVKEVCQAVLRPDRLQAIAIAAVEEARKADRGASERQTLQDKMEHMTAHMEQLYMDRLSGLLSEADFQRVY